MELMYIEPTKVGQRETAEQIYQELTEVTNDVYEQFSSAKTLSNAADSAANQMKQAFLQQARKDHPEEVAKGTKFVHRNVAFRINRVAKYDFTFDPEWTALNDTYTSAYEWMISCRKRLKEREETLKKNPAIEPLSVQETPVLLS